MAESPLARVRRLCLELPQAHEKFAWSAPTFRVGRAQKMFATYVDHHHGDPRLTVWCHAPLGKQAVLVASEPERYFRPPYVGGKGWLGLDLAKFSDQELRLHLREAWEQVAPRKLREVTSDKRPRVSASKKTQKQNKKKKKQVAARRPTRD